MVEFQHFLYTLFTKFIRPPVKKTIQGHTF